MRNYRTMIVVLCALAINVFSLTEAQENKENVAFRWGFGARVGKDKKFVSITRDTALKTGDEIKMVIELKKECYVYVILQDSRGGVSFLFPENVKQFASDYKSGKNYYIPKGREWNELDKNTGKETIYLLASAERLVELEALMGNYSSTDEARKEEAAKKIVAEIRDVKKRYRTFQTLAERPVTIGGNIRGVEAAEQSRRPDVSTIMTEISANNFYSKTFTIDHQ